MKRGKFDQMLASGLTGRAWSAKRNSKIGRGTIAEYENDYRGCRRRDV